MVKRGKGKFFFSPPVELVLANMSTVRQVQKVCYEGALETDIKHFIREFGKTVAEVLPKVAAWQVEPYADSIYWYPNRRWRVVKEDHIAFEVSFESLISPENYDDRDDPWVGLYVPENWKHIKAFNNQCFALTPKGFTHIHKSKSGTPEDFDPSYPIGTCVSLKKCAKGPAFDANRLQTELLVLLRMLMAKDALIESLIAELNSPKR
jgi:hypothetical protein